MALAEAGGTHDNGFHPVGCVATSIRGIARARSRRKPIQRLSQNRHLMDESAQPPIAAKPGRRWLRLLDRWLIGAYEDNATGLAAQLSYDFIFLLAPGPLLVSALLAIFGTDPTTLANI